MSVGRRRAAGAVLGLVAVPALLFGTAPARAGETVLPERAWIAHCVALRTSPGTPPRTVRAYCRCMPGVVGALVRYDTLNQLVRAWPHSDAHCRRRSRLR